MISVVLFSGGMDSLYCLAQAMQQSEAVVALSIDYGQRHKKELLRAESICAALNVTHRIVKYNGLTFAKSALTTGEQVTEVKENGLPAAELPGRNLAFIAIANSYAQSIGAGRIYIGCCASDLAGFPDCRPSFIDAIANAVRLNASSELTLLAPALLLSKAEIKQGCVEAFGQTMFDLTWSCYQGDGIPCEQCPACVARNSAAR